MAVRLLVRKKHNIRRELDSDVHGDFVYFVPKSCVVAAKRADEGRRLPEISDLPDVAKP